MYTNTSVITTSYDTIDRLVKAINLPQYDHDYKYTTYIPSTPVSPTASTVSTEREFQILVRDIRSGECACFTELSPKSDISFDNDDNKSETGSNDFSLTTVYVDTQETQTDYSYISKTPGDFCVDTTESNINNDARSQYKYRKSCIIMVTKRVEQGDNIYFLPS